MQEARTAPNAESLIDIGTVADRLGYSRRTIRKLVDQGRLPALQIVPGGRLRFRSSDVQALIEGASRR